MMLLLLMLLLLLLLLLLQVSDIAAKAKRTCVVHTDPNTGKKSEEDIKKCADGKNFLLGFDREAFKVRFGWMWVLCVVLCVVWVVRGGEA
jgi:hypothetical protein